ncbi:MAG: FAD-binding oxidoreductase [Thermoplasmata archaeon]
MKNFDTIVIGAGITGLSSAYHLKRENPDLEICIVEKEPTYGQGNTGKSAAGFRDLFTSEINFKLSSTSISFYKHIQEDIGFDLGMNFVGYLFLMDNDSLDSEGVRKIRKRTDTLMLSKEDVSDLGFNTNLDRKVKEIMGLKDIDGGLLGKNCGIIEPDLILTFYARELEKMGVEMKFNTEVERLNIKPVVELNYPGEPYVWQEKIIKSIKTNNGELSAENYVLATDVWTNVLLDPLGIDSHIRPKKRQIFQVSGDKIKDMVTMNYKKENGIFPFTFLPKPWVYLRPEPKSKSFWVGLSDDIGRDFSLEKDPQPEIEYYNKNIYLIANEYIPAFHNSKVTSSWAGYYSLNTIDGTYYVFKEMNIIVATGSSGSGILKGDAVGRIVSALVSSKEKAVLYGGEKINIDDLGVKNRKTPTEEFVI